MSKRSENFRRVKIFRAVRIALAAIAVLALTLVHVFSPFRTLLPAYALPRRAEGELRLHFLDVGQGDCTIVEFPEGDLLVVDGGNGAWRAENNLIRYIKSLNPARVSLLATHADYDHIGGLRELLTLFGADEVYMPAIPSETGAYRAFEAAASAAGAELKTLSRYGVIAKDSGAYAVCISPYSREEAASNDASAVLYLSYSGVNVLLCGDVSSAREEQLLQEYELDESIFDAGEYRVRLSETNILKTAHHGSSSSSSLRWLSLLSPQTAVISCGRGNFYSHPSQEAVERLARVGADIYRTDELGNLMIGISNGSYSVYTHITG